MGKTESSSRTRLYDIIYRNGVDWPPGYWGRLPYLFLLRCAIALGLWLRFWVNRDHPMPAWSWLALIAAMPLAFKLHWRPKETYSRMLYVLIVGFDIAIVSVFYWHTHRVESDLFLFYILPIFTAAEFLRARWVLAAFCAISLSFAAVIYFMPIDGRYSELPRIETLARVFMAREVFFLAVSLTWALRLRRERDSRERAVSRQHQMQLLLECKQKIDPMFKPEETLQVVVAYAGRGLDARNAVGLIEILKTSVPTQLTPEPGETQAQREAVSKKIGQDDKALAELYGSCQEVFEGSVTAKATPIVAFGRTVGSLAAQDSHDSNSYGTDTREFLVALTQIMAAWYERVCLLTVTTEVGAAAAIAVDYNRRLEDIMVEVTETMRFDYALISLVDLYRDQIWTVRGRNVPPGWISSSRFKLDGKDILADIVRTGKTETFDSYDERFNYPIWNRYGHDRLFRVFVPISAGSGNARKAIGVLEAGCDKSRRHLVESLTDRVRSLGEASGDAIARSLPSVLLELVARRAIGLIGAESASIHVYRGADEFLTASTGKAGKEFVQNHPPSSNGIGRLAMQQRIHQVQNELPDSKAALKALGIHAMAAFPLILSENVMGVLYIHFWRPRKFSQSDVELVNTLVPQMEIAIRNHLVMYDSLKHDEDGWMLAGLQNVLRSIASEPKIDLLLERLAGDVLRMLDAKNVTLYQYFQEDRHFSRAVLAGKFDNKEVMATEVHRDDVVSKIVLEGRTRFFSDADTNPFLRQARADEIARPRFVDREGIKSCAVLLLKSPYDSEIVGCLFANHEERKDYESEELKGYQQLANLLAGAAAMAIKAARLHASDLEDNARDIGRRELELEALRNINRTIVESADKPDRDKLSSYILSQALRVLAPLSDVTLIDVLFWEPEQHLLKVAACHGYPLNWRGSITRLGEGVVGWVAENCHPLLVPDVTKDDRYHEVNRDTKSEVAVPIIGSDGKIFGVLNVEHKSVNAFSERDKTFLEMVALQSTVALEGVRLYHKLQRQIQQALALKTVAMRAHNSDPNRIRDLRRILVGLTARDGLSFSRAMMFEVAEDGKRLCGLISAGSRTQDEADATWKQTAGCSFDQFLDAAESLPMDTSREGRTPLEKELLEIAIPLAELPKGLDSLLRATTQSDARTLVVRLRSSELTGSPLARLYGAESLPLVCVPLKAGPTPLGILLLDNRFLYFEDELDSGTEPILVAFAELAAMTIESRRLRAKLADENQLRQWRQASDRFAHILGTRVLNLETKVSDLDNSLDLLDIPSSQNHVLRVRESIRDFSVQLNRIKSFSTVHQQLVMSRVDLNEVLGHIANEQKRNLNCNLQLQFTEEHLLVLADSSQIKDVFIDLLFNADREMRKARTPRPTLVIQTFCDEDSGRAVVKVQDNGPGILPEIRDRLFEPYVSTSPTGTGLGLAIIKDLVERHNGDIFCDSTDKTRTVFRVSFPLLAKERFATA